MDGLQETEIRPENTDRKHGDNRRVSGDEYIAQSLRDARCLSELRGGIFADCFDYMKNPAPLYRKTVDPSTDFHRDVTEPFLGYGRQKTQVSDANTLSNPTSIVCG